MQNVPQNEKGSEREVKTSLTVRLPKALDRELEHAATDRDLSKQQVVEDALRAYLDAHRWEMTA